jgi:hypothetical protein
LSSFTDEEMRFQPDTGYPMRAERDAQHRDTFVEALRAAVPLWMAHWWRWPPEIREARGRYCGQIVGTFGDQIQWPSKGTKDRVVQEATDEQDAIVHAGSPGTAEAFNRLAEGLAIAAYHPGGVTAFGQHWEICDEVEA